VKYIVQIGVAELRLQRGIVKGRRILLTAGVVTQIVATRRINEVGPTGVTTVHPGAAVVHHHVADDQYPPLLRLPNQALQIRQRAHPRIHGVKIGGGVAVIIPVGVFQDRGDPDGCRAERLNVIELLLDTLEITSVRLATVGGIKIGQSGHIVAGVPVGKTIGDDLVDVLFPPKIHVGHGGKVGIPCEQDAVDVEPGIPHPEIQSVSPSGGNVEGHQVSRAGCGVGPSPGIELLQIDPWIGQTAPV